MQDTISPLKRLEAALSDTSGIYVNSGVDEEHYFADLADGIRSCICEPFPVTATVTEPGFPDRTIGSTIRAICLAKRDGYWLVYDEERDQFLCFWGVSADNLGAPGIFGSPLYCWSA